MSYFIVSGDDAEEEVQKRLASRAAKSEWQAALDSDKVGVNGYYEGRATMVRTSASTYNLPLVEYSVGRSKEWLVEQLANITLA